MIDNSLDILQKYWGYGAFRAKQQEIVHAAIDGNDVLGILPTGGGKSICFQVPAMAKEGTCIVVSPLISLMKDQVETLQKQQIKASAIYTGLSKREIDTILDNVVYGDVKFLYVSPERLRSPLFLERLKKMKVNYLVIDEAHCISQWGYDFRPAYLLIKEIKQLLRGVPVLAFTASATDGVREDILQKLGIPDARVERASFLRENLSYSIFKEENKYDKTVQILSKVGGSAIVYANTRKRCVEIAKYLYAQKIKVDVYHAGLSVKERVAKQESWMKGTTRVIVATNAFGMGIDKSDVRTVIHFDIPGSPEAYYQEAGRAGRDGKKAYAVALYTEADIERLYKNLDVNYPDETYLKQIYQALANYLSVAIGGNQFASYDFSLQQFVERYNFKSVEAYRAIQLLEKYNLVKMTEGFYEPSKLMFLMEKMDLYRFQVANPQFDEFIKSTMRIYGGILHGHYVKISEELIARKSSKNQYEVRKLFFKLNKLGVLNYIPQKSTPQIAFLDYRYDAKKLPLQLGLLKVLKANDQKRLEAMSDFLLNNEQCRSHQLAGYFGEYLKEDCGICDVCVSKRDT